MRDQSPISDADQEFLDGLLEQAIERLEQDQPLSVDALLDGHVHLRARAEGVIRLAREVAIGRSGVLPKVRGYSILAEIGQGGMGTVYLARQERVAGRLVALKVLPAASALSTRARDRFVREAEAIARLHHPHVITIFDVVHSGGVLAYAMEWIDGFTLANAIEEKATQRRGDEATKDEQGDKSPPSLRGSVASSPSIHDICHIGISIARALAAVHAVGLLHRDVKPSNILLRRDGSAVLTDFGLVREADSTVTQPGHFAGTPAYSAPEQLRGDIEQIDVRSDVYSLGVTLYHALAQRLPFERAANDGAMGALSPTAMFRLIENGAITPLRGVNPQVPRDLDTIISTAMDPDPARRYQTAGELADDLERLLTLRPIKARPTGLMTRTYKLARRNRRSLAAAVLGAIAALALGTAAVIYAFFVPGWTAAHVRQARLMLLEPGQANNIVSSLYWGRYSRLDAAAWDARLRDFERALKAYDAALRLAPFDEAIRRERAIVQAARDAKHEETGKGNRSHRPTISGATDETVGQTTDPPHADPRSAGLFAFLTQDYDAALARWAEYDKTRNPLETPDPLVDTAMGILYLFDEKAALAYPRLQHAVQAFPGVRFLLEYLADAAVKCGDVDRAEQWLNEAKPLDNDPSLGAHERIGAALLAARGRTDDAVAAYRRITHLGVPAVELARLLNREGRLNEALEAWLAAAERFSNSPRVQAAFMACADRWWASLSKANRCAEIESVLQSEHPLATRLFRILRHRAGASVTTRMGDPVASYLCPFSPTWWLFPRFTALTDVIFSPSLQSLSLNELAERMEVENMSLWSRMASSPTILKEIQFSAWRWPVLRPASRLATWAFVAFDDEQKRRLRLFRLAAVSAAVMLTGATSQPANGQCTTPPCFQGLGDLPGGAISSDARGLSSDGSTVVGASSSSASGSGTTEAFRWTAVSGIAGLGDLPGAAYASMALAVSADGSVVTGWSASGNSNFADQEEAFRWTQTNGMIGLGDHPDGLFYSSATSVDDSGNTIAGGIWRSGYQAGIWSGGVWTWTGWPTNSVVYGLSADGSVWVGGVEDSPGGGVYRQFRNTQILGEGDLPGGITEGRAFGVSGDGNIVVGYGYSAAGREATRWTAATGLASIGDLPGGTVNAWANSVSPDGALIVGYGTTANGLEAAIWDASQTAARVADVLTANGVSIPSGWSLSFATDVTINAGVVSICGNGTNPQGNPEAWIARYTLPPVCDAADILQSPAPATAPFGGTAQLNVVADGTAPLSYQWRKDNVPLTDGPVGCGGTISGATTDTLVLNTVTFVEGGNYECVATNACGNDTSTAATLTITPPPAAADVNHDGQVNGSDIQALIAALLAP